MTQQTTHQMTGGIQIFYDGECPLCSSYVRMINLRRAVGQVELIDARSGDLRVAELRAQGVDFDSGMAVRHGGRLCHGAEAMALLSALSSGRGPLIWLMRAPRRAALVYPVLRAGRGALLRLLGRSRIG
ncbi:DUF393 domain-containing protein [Paracoccus sp. DMF-8]|uniref:thiol-disulfide oxidoreductase DCC family protein n=1 Tax=Paracoccus sp. DMF-8 TaxID=3019445 RepID=UPI0023E7EB7D|nr:DUF393 domain-containing protein [Paracoccus sp. DMF-8]MDF3607124.1 DUF393 domain-containing protein [Paracoccus sp. DMF-8]